MSEATPPALNNEKEPSFFAENKKLIIVAGIVIVMLVFIFQNMHDVRFWLLFIPVTMPMVVLILLFFSIGASAVWVYSYFNKKELKKKIRTLEAQIKKLESGQ